MDYTYFTAAPLAQPYQYFGLSSTIPNETETPPNADEFTSFTTPVSAPPIHTQGHRLNFLQEQYDLALNLFQQNYRNDAQSYLQQNQEPQSQSPIKSGRHDSIVSITDIQNGLPALAQEFTNEEQQQRQRSSSEEKDAMTPAQSRRKAQNRAA